MCFVLVLEPRTRQEPGTLTMWHFILHAEVTTTFVDLVLPSTPWNMNMAEPLGTGMKLFFSVAALFLAFLDFLTESGLLEDVELDDKALTASFVFDCNFLRGSTRLVFT